MQQESKLAEIGILNILNQMKNPLTNIRLSVEMMESGKADPRESGAIIKNSAISLEASIRDLCRSFSELGISIHLGDDHSTYQGKEIRPRLPNN